MSIPYFSGGGFALSTAAKKDYSDLNGKIGQALIGLQSLPNMVIILIIIILTVLITNFASNVAVCNVIVPIAMTLVSGNSLFYRLKKRRFSFNYIFFVRLLHCMLF